MQPEPVRPMPMQSMTNAIHANAIHDQYNPWPMQSMPMRLRQNITLLPKHGGIVAAVGRIFVKNMRVTR